MRGKEAKKRKDEEGKEGEDEEGKLMLVRGERYTIWRIIMRKMREGSVRE